MIRHLMRRTGWLALALVPLLAFPGAALGSGSFAPGLWKGTGRLTGGFHGHDVTVNLTGGGRFTFCLLVTRTGHVNASTSKWRLGPTAIVENLAGKHLTGDMGGTGPLSGTPSHITVGGSMTVTITLSAGGHTITVPTTVLASGTLPVTHSMQSTVTGDIAIRSRAAQQHAGFSSNETGNYTALPVSTCTP
jgi:hypothetical protein